MKSNLKAIIFDMDGVIFESLDMKSHVFAELFKDYPDKVNAIVKYHLDNGGATRETKFEFIYSNILKMPLDDKTAKGLGSDFSRIVLSKMGECAFVRGAREIFERYHKDMDLFVVSAVPQCELEQILELRDIRKYFTAVLGTPVVKYEHTSRIMKEYSLNAKDVIFVGDSREDYVASVKCGIEFIGRISQGDRDAFAGCGVSVQIRDMVELGEIIGRYSI